jgi:hypothetical protein
VVRGLVDAAEPDRRHAAELVEDAKEVTFLEVGRDAAHMDGHVFPRLGFQLLLLRVS